MSVSIEIMPAKGKRYTLKELLPEGLEYGTYGEGYVLKEADGEDSVIVFDPACICRGICVEISEDAVMLGLSEITGAGEIRLFYDLARRICGLFGTGVFSREGSIVSSEQTERFLEEDLSSARAGLEVMLSKLEGSDDCVTVFGALNPIALSAADLKEIGADPVKFGAFLHEKQSANAYYAVPQVFQDPRDRSLVGVYSVPCGTRTVMPFVPAPPFYLQEKVDRWVVYIYISDSRYGYVELDDFMKAAPRLGTYDAAHYLTKLDEAAAEKLIKVYPAKM